MGRKLSFNDGWSVDIDGPFRVIRGPDGWYVIGNGLLIPVDSEQEGIEEIERQKGEDNDD